MMVTGRLVRGTDGRRFYWAPVAGDSIVCQWKDRQCYVNGKYCWLVKVGDREIALPSHAGLRRLGLWLYPGDVVEISCLDTNNGTLYIYSVKKLDSEVKNGI